MKLGIYASKSLSLRIFRKKFRKTVLVATVIRFEINGFKRHGYLQNYLKHLGGEVKHIQEIEKK